MNCPPVATYLIGNTCSMKAERTLNTGLWWDALPTLVQLILAPALLLVSMAAFYLLVGFGFGFQEVIGELPGRIWKAIKENYKKSKETPK